MEKICGTGKHVSSNGSRSERKKTLKKTQKLAALFVAHDLRVVIFLCRTQRRDRRIALGLVDGSRSIGRNTQCFLASKMTGIKVQTNNLGSRTKCIAFGWCQKRVGYFVGYFQCRSLHFGFAIFRTLKEYFLLLDIDMFVRDAADCPAASKSQS